MKRLFSVNVKRVFKDISQLIRLETKTVLEVFRIVDAENTAIGIVKGNIGGMSILKYFS
jgi:hypothetical protein